MSERNHGNISTKLKTEKLHKLPNLVLFCHFSRFVYCNNFVASALTYLHLMNDCITLFRLKTITVVNFFESDSDCL